MRVVTLAMVDAVHKRPEETAGRNFRANKHRLIEGEDYFTVGADEFRRHLDPSLSKFASEDITLLTESGYMLLVKSFTDDLAWNVQRRLVNAYFKVKAEYINTAQRQELCELVSLIVASGKQTHGETWARFHNKFHVNSYHELRADKFKEAYAYLSGKFDGESKSALLLLVDKHIAPRQLALFNEGAAL